MENQPTQDQEMNGASPDPVSNPPQPAANVFTEMPQSAEPQSVSVAGPAPVSPTQVGAVKKARSKWLMPAVLAAILLTGGGAAAYVTVFQKSPENLLKSALNNTATGLETYLKVANNSDVKGFTLDGNIKVSSPIALDSTSEGKWYEMDGELKSTFGAAGARVTMDLKTKSVENASNPDIYLKVDGLDGIPELLSAFGGSEIGEAAADLSSINGQWFFVDHTYLDQLTASTGGSTEALTPEELTKISESMAKVMRERLFSSDPTTRVFSIAEKIGKEDFEGVGTYKMKVKVEKENFNSFVTALKDAAKETKLEDALLMGQTDKTIEEVIGFDDMIKELEKADFSKATADVWVEANGKYIRNFRLYPMENKKDTNYLDFMINYKGGDVIPMLVRATIDDDGTKGTLGFGMDINSKNGDVEFSINADMTSSGSPVKATAKLALKGSNEKVTVEVPEDAQNIFELIGGLTNLGGGLGQEDALLETYPEGFDFEQLPQDDLELQ
jgi:hypothetical protein